MRDMETEKNPAVCLHPTVIRYWTDDLRFDPPRCLDCGVALDADSNALLDDDPAEREAFLAFTASAR